MKWNIECNNNTICNISQFNRYPLNLVFNLSFIYICAIAIEHTLASNDNNTIYKLDCTGEVIYHVLRLILIHIYKALYVLK